MALPPVRLPDAMGALPVWEVLRADRWQQRVFTWGHSALAPAAQLGRAADSPAGSVQALTQQGLSMGGEPAAAATAAALRDRLPHRYTSPKPVSVAEGVEFTCVGAGESEPGRQRGSGTYQAGRCSAVPAFVQ